MAMYPRVSLVEFLMTEGNVIFRVLVQGKQVHDSMRYGRQYETSVSSARILAMVWLYCALVEQTSRRTTRQVFNIGLII